MISKGQIKSITGLQQKKYRDKAGLFVAEGPKVIAELKKQGVEMVSFFSILPSEITSEKDQLVTAAELQKISFLKTANTSLAVFKIPSEKPLVSEGLVVALDAVRDPGNLGTIIRLCDWFDVSQLVCSLDTADCYNPKVVQATMGSIARVPVVYTDLSEFIKNTALPVFGGCMEGKNVYKEKLPANAVIVMGNEGKGISSFIEKLLTHTITIPQFGASQDTESLNVATATAILLSEFKRTTET